MFPGDLHLSSATVRALIPGVLALAATSLLVGTLGSDRLLTTIPGVTDADVFRPGGLMLLEAARLHRAGLLSALGTVAIIFLIAQIPLLIIRARLYATVVDLNRSRKQRRGLFEHLASYIGLTILQWIALLLVLTTTALALRFSMPLEGAFPPRAVTEKLLWLFLGGLMALTTVTFFDLLKLALFDERRVGVVRWAAMTLRQHGTKLVTVRGLRAALTLGFGVVALQITTRPIAGTSWAAFTFTFTQMLAVATLSLEAWWMVFANRQLQAVKSSVDADTLAQA